jgi:hypothetical protein
LAHNRIKPSRPSLVGRHARPTFRRGSGSSCSHLRIGANDGEGCHWAVAIDGPQGVRTAVILGSLPYLALTRTHCAHQLAQRSRKCCVSGSNRRICRQFRRGELAKAHFSPGPYPSGRRRGFCAHIFSSAWGLDIPSSRAPVAYVRSASRCFCVVRKYSALNPKPSQWLHEIKHDGFRVIARKDR